jgi:hypothetical protein
MTAVQYFDNRVIQRKSTDIWEVSKRTIVSSVVDTRSVRLSAVPCVGGKKQISEIIEEPAFVTVHFK